MIWVKLHQSQVYMSNGRLGLQSYDMWNECRTNQGGISLTGCLYFIGLFRILLVGLTGVYKVGVPQVHEESLRGECVCGTCRKEKGPPAHLHPMNPVS